MICFEKERLEKSQGSATITNRGPSQTPRRRENRQIRIMRKRNTKGDCKVQTLALEIITPFNECPWRLSSSRKWPDRIHRHLGCNFGPFPSRGIGDMVCRHEQHQCVGTSPRYHIQLRLGIFWIAAAHQTSHAEALVADIFRHLAQHLQTWRLRRIRVLFSWYLYRVSHMENEEEILPDYVIMVVCSFCFFHSVREEAVSSDRLAISRLFPVLDSSERTWHWTSSALCNNLWCRS